MKSKMRIGFSRNWGPFSLLIQAVTLSRMSHMYVVIEVPKHDETIVYHAHGQAVQATNAREFYKKNTVVSEFEFNMSEADSAFVMKFILSNLGKAYSFLQNIGMLWVLIGRLFKCTWTNPLSNGDSAWNCSELGARVLRMENPEDKAPSDVHAEIVARGVGVKVA
jgi:uncharacterized protein (UPF0333 family)